MPEQATIERAKQDKREGKAPSTQAGEFIREEMHHIREGKHGARSAKQAVAIGLSKARRAGVNLRPPGKARYPQEHERTPNEPTRQDKSILENGHHARVREPPSTRFNRKEQGLHHRRRFPGKRGRVLVAGHMPTGLLRRNRLPGPVPSGATVSGTDFRDPPVLSG